MLIPKSTLTPATIRIPEPPHRLETRKRLAAKDMWKIAALPHNENSRLNEETDTVSDYWFNTNGAATYCLCKTGDSETDWYNLFKENRRLQIDLIAAMSLGKKPRGNAYRLGRLQFHTVRKKVYYTKSDLDKWLAGISSRTIH